MTDTSSRFEREGGASASSGRSHDAGGEASGDARCGSGDETISVWEWAVAILGALLLAALLAFLLHEAANADERPPDVVVGADSVVPVAGGHLLLVTARNRGGATAADLEVLGTLTIDSVTVEESSVTIDYLPPRGRRAAGLFFRQDPRSARVELRAVGYREP